MHAMMQVKLATSEDLVFVPHPVHDPLTFKSLASLNAQTANDGFYGGLRLLKVSCLYLSRGLCTLGSLQQNCS